LEEIFKTIPDHFKRGDEYVLTHFSPSSLLTPLDIWTFNYLHLGDRRRDVPIGAPAPAGTVVHDAIQSVVSDGEDPDQAIRHAISVLQYHSPRDEDDAVRLTQCLEDVAPMVENGLDAMNEIFKTEGDIEATKEQVIGFEHKYLDVPIIGYVDFSTKKSIIELKTKSSRMGRVKKDGTRSFSAPSVPKTPDVAHVSQVALYNAATGKPPTIVYITAKGWGVFNQENCKALSPQNLQAHTARLIQAARVRQNLLKISNDPKVLAGYIQPDWSNFRWKIGDEFLAEAKEIWKL